MANMNLWNEYLTAVKTPTGHRSELISIQWLRGMAVLMVLIYHLEDIAQHFAPFQDFRSPWRAVGYSAPDMFFVISGYIMCYVTFGMRFEPKKWLVSRFIRIYPLYIFFTFLAFVPWLINPDFAMGSEQNWESVLLSFLLLPQEGTPLLFVGWTVEHEIVFYAIVFVVAATLGERALIPILGTLSALAVLRWFFADDHPWMVFWDWHFLSLFMVQFLIGALIFQYREILRKTGVAAPAIAGLVLFFSGAWFAKPMPLNHEDIGRILVFGFAYGLVMLAAINRETALREEKGDAYLPKKRPLLVKLGDASYSVYLAHPFVMAVANRGMSMMGLEGAPVLIGVAIAGIIMIWGGILFYELVEKPLLHFMKILFTNKKRRVAQDPATS